MHTSKNNYRLVRVLPVISEIFEGIVCNQISAYFENIFSKFQCGFRKGYSTQPCLLMILVSWKVAVDKSKPSDAPMTNFLEAFDCLSHDLLIAKLHAYEIYLSSLKLLQDYLSNSQRCALGKVSVC